MARTPQDVTDAELAILEVLWELDSATIRQITDNLYPHGGSARERDPGLCREIAWLGGHHAHMHDLFLFR